LIVVMALMMECWQRAKKEREDSCMLHPATT
jgi:hypothetical protein